MERALAEEKNRAARLVSDKTSADQYVTRLEKTVLMLHAMLQESEVQVNNMKEQNNGLEAQLSDWENKAKSSPAAISRTKTMLIGTKKTVLNTNKKQNVL